MVPFLKQRKNILFFAAVLSIIAQIGCSSKYLSYRYGKRFNYHIDHRVGLAIIPSISYTCDDQKIRLIDLSTTKGCWSLLDCKIILNRLDSLGYQKMNIVFFDIIVDSTSNNGLYYIQNINQFKDSLDRPCSSVYNPMIKIGRQIYIFPEGIQSEKIDPAITYMLESYFVQETLDSISQIISVHLK